jgi:hypothetical protein
MALGIHLGAPSSEAKAFADLEADLDEEKAALVPAQIEADMLPQAV